MKQTTAWLVTCAMTASVVLAFGAVIGNDNFNAILNLGIPQQAGSARSVWSPQNDEATDGSATWVKRNASERRELGSLASPAPSEPKPAPDDIRTLNDEPRQQAKGDEHDLPQANGEPGPHDVQAGTEPPASNIAPEPKLPQVESERQAPRVEPEPRERSGGYEPVRPGGPEVAEPKVEPEPQSPKDETQTLAEIVRVPPAEPVTPQISAASAPGSDDADAADEIKSGTIAAPPQAAPCPTCTQRQSAARPTRPVKTAKRQPKWRSEQRFKKTSRRAYARWYPPDDDAIVMPAPPREWRHDPPGPHRCRIAYVPYGWTWHRVTHCP